MSQLARYFDGAARLERAAQDPPAKKGTSAARAYPQACFHAFARRPDYFGALSGSAAVEGMAP